jgi:hypothetical protein
MNTSVITVMLSLKFFIETALRINPIVRIAEALRWRRCSPYSVSPPGGNLFHLPPERVVQPADMEIAVIADN